MRVPRWNRCAYSVGMTRKNGVGNDQSAKESDPHMGSVPDKQLHRWKDEGGAMPPELIPASDDEDDDA